MWVFSYGVEGLVFVLNQGRRFGQVALLLFLVTTLPGMLGRFKIRHALITIGIMFRRYMGIATFLFALCHALITFLIPLVLSRQPLFPLANYVVFGVFALLTMLPLFLTSNDWSVKTLGPNWKKIHKLVYVIFWFIFLHVAFQRLSIWTVLIGIAAVGEVISLLWDWLQKPSRVQSTPIATSQTKEEV